MPQKTMIKVKHPKDEINRNQEQFLASCPPGEHRFHELIFTFGNIVFRYHSDAIGCNPTQDDYKEWLGGLPKGLKKEMEKLGFEGCKTVLSFTRYVMEKNDKGLEEYIKMHMDTEDYKEYQKLIKRNKNS